MGFFTFIIKTNEKELKKINLKLYKIMSTQAELAQQLRDVKAQNDKAREERLAHVATLEQAIIDAGNVTEEVQTALDDLKSSVQSDDDLITDAETGGDSGDEEPV